MNVLRVFKKIPKLTSYKIKSCLDFRRSFSQTSKLCSFFERDRRGANYPLVVETDWKELFHETNKTIVREWKLFMNEMKEKFILQDPKMYYDGDTDVFWRFDSEECLKQWRTGSDKTNKEGTSEFNFIINDKKKGVFYGNLDLTPPKDGQRRYSGYCGIRTLNKKKSFYRDDYYDFEGFTHLEMRIRGDGRSYAIHLGVGMYFDVNWFDMYTYSIFTHGGPYWQLVRIPFSKFFLTSKGRIQDKQCPAPLNRINSIGITAAGVAGPFRLEIDYIGCHIDNRHKEEFAYESYDIPKEYVSS